MKSLKPGLVWKPFYFLLLFISISFFSGCMSSPQNDQPLLANAPVNFAGLIPEGNNGQAPQGDVIVSHGSDNVGTFPVAQSNPQTDSTGKKWYSWGGSKIIPYRLWEQVPEKREIKTQIQASLGGMPMQTFDYVPPSNPQCEEAMRSNDSMQIITYCQNYVSPSNYPAVTAQCEDAKKTGNYIQIIGACKSTESPVVTLISKCGGYKEPCCKTSSPCGGAYECGEITYDPDDPPDGEYSGVVGRAYNPNTAVSAGQEKATLCLARMPDNTLR